MEALPAKVIELFGAVDGIIYNAGIIQPFVRLNDLEYDAIQRVLDVNLYGTLYMVKAFLPLTCWSAPQRTLPTSPAWADSCRCLDKPSTARARLRSN